MQPVYANRPFTLIDKVLKLFFEFPGQPVQAEASADKRYKFCPEVAMTFKSITDPMVMSGSALTRTGAAQQLLELVRAASVFGGIEPKMRRVPFRTNIPIEATAAGASWVSEGGGIPVFQNTYTTSALLEPLKLGVIVVISAELAKASAPASEAEIRRSVVRGIAKQLDSSFLDPASIAISGKQPASITSAGQNVVSSGSTDVLIQADLISMLAKLGSSVSPVWIAKPKLAARLSTTFGAVGYNFPNIMGFPIIASENSPSQLVLLDADAVLIADEGAVDLNSTTEASLEMSSTPLSGLESPMVSATIKSLFQNDLVGLRAIRTINWQLGDTNACVTMAVSY